MYKLFRSLAISREHLEEVREAHRSQKEAAEENNRLQTNLIAQKDKEIDELRRSNRLREQQTRNHFLEYYASDEMRKGVQRLAKFERTHGSTFPKVFAKMLEKDTPEADELSMDSGRVTQHFDAILTAAFGETDDVFVRSVVNTGQVKFLLDIIEHMEEAKNHEYEKRMFDEYRRIYKEDLKER